MRGDYPGYRVTIETFFDNLRQTLKIDITTGEVITPREIEYKFKLLLEDRTIGITAYNLETVLAEKFETIISRGAFNTRMRDFYDIYVLTTTQEFNIETFRIALKMTSLNRGTAEQTEKAESIITIIENNQILVDLWKRYQNIFFYAEDITWDKCIHSL